MICPLLKDKCQEQSCAWWDCGNRSCAVLSLVVERIKATEAILDTDMRSSHGVNADKLNITPNVTVHPVVQVKEIIRNIKMEPVNGTIEDSPSKISSPITW